MWKVDHDACMTHEYRRNVVHDSNTHNPEPNLSWLVCDVAHYARF